MRVIIQVPSSVAAIYHLIVILLNFYQLLALLKMAHQPSVRRPMELFRDIWSVWSAV